MKRIRMIVGYYAIRVNRFFYDLIHQKLFNSYSQFGEDLILERLLNNKQHGIYLDVGANDPDIYNNTKRFYQRGWSGINIEPDVELFEKLCKIRPRDINLNIGIGSIKGEMTFYKTSADTLSTFSEHEVQNLEKEGYEVISAKKVPVLPLVDIFTKHLADKHVDFMSLDVEGLELDVLKSNDWSRFRPFIVVAEINKNVEKIIHFLKEHDYELVYNNKTNGIFEDKKSIKC